MTDDDNTLLLQANWLREVSARDPDVKAGFLSALAARGYDSIYAFVDADPDGFVAVVDALRDMTEQVPIEETWSVGEGKPSSSR